MVGFVFNSAHVLYQAPNNKKKMWKECNSSIRMAECNRKVNHTTSLGPGAGISLGTAIMTFTKRHGALA